MANLPKIGIDIGSSAIKLVELVPSGSKWKLASAASMPTVGGITAASANTQAISGAIAAIVKEAGMRSRKAVVAIPEEQVSSHIVELPLLSENEIEQALEWQVEQYIPIPKDQAQWSWEIVKKDEVGGGVEVLLVASAKSLVETYRKAVEGAGLELVAVETELVATSRSEVDARTPLAVVVDIGARSTDLGIVRSGQLVFSRTIPTGGEAFSRALETGLGLDKTQAEQYKLTYGMASQQLEGKVAEAMKPVMAIIIAEVRKTIDFYVSKHPGELVKLVILSGGVSGMPEIIGVLSTQLGVEVVIGDPFSKLVMDDQQRKSFAGTGPFYGVAVGLAMREL